MLCGFDVKHTITITGESQRARAIDIVSSLPADGSKVVTIADKVKDRSGAQRGLQWMWYTFIAGETGETKEEVHSRYKQKYAVNILTRDDPEFSSMIETVRKVWKLGAKDEANKLYDDICDRISIEYMFNVKQRAEYLDLVDKHCIGVQINLPRPEEQYCEAMGN